MNNQEFIGTVFSKLDKETVVEFHNKYSKKYNSAVRPGSEDYIIAYHADDKYLIIIPDEGLIPRDQVTEFVLKRTDEFDEFTNQPLNDRFFNDPALEIMIDCTKSILR